MYMMYNFIICAMVEEYQFSLENAILQCWAYKNINYVISTVFQFIMLKLFVCFD